jgi:hypothetical protein
MASSHPPDPEQHLVEPEEVVDGVPVLAGEVRALEPVRRQLPAVQAAAVAATGFVAGAAAVVAIQHRRAARKPARRRRGANGNGAVAETLSVVGTRSFLLDVHLLGRNGE